VRPARQAPVQLHLLLPLKCTLSCLLAAEPTKISSADGVAEVQTKPWPGTPKAYHSAGGAHAQLRIQRSAPVGQQGGQGGDGARRQGDGASTRFRRKLPAAAMHDPATPPLQHALNHNSADWLTLTTQVLL
jgi:hypothetical protein